MGLPTASDLYTYDPSQAASILFNVLYSLLIGPHFFLSCRRWRSRPVKHRYTFCLVVAAMMSNCGYAVRTASVSPKNRGNVGLYAASSSLIMVTPIFVCATLYLLLVRMIQVYLPLRHQTVFNISPRLLGNLFVCSNVVSFLTQGAGSGIAASGGWQRSSKTAGIDILLTGLALQLATFTLFLAVAWTFVRRVAMIEEGSIEPDLRKMLTGVWVAAILVEIRSIYRVVEFALGIGGYPFQHEWPLYVLEATPIFFAIGILAIYHPVKLVQGSLRVTLDDEVDVQTRKFNLSRNLSTHLVGLKRGYGTDN